MNAANYANMTNSVLPMTIGRGIRTAALRNPRKTAIYCDGERLRYWELKLRIEKVTAAAATSGFKPGSNVTLLAPNCLEYIEVVAGLGDAGVVVVTANSHTKAAELRALLIDSQSHAIFVHPACEEIARAASIISDDRVYVLGSSYDKWRDSAVCSVDIQAVSDESSFAISYTSGTTGQPKGIMLSHRSRALSFLAAAAEYGCYGADDHSIAVAPLYHGGGFIFGVAPLFTGGCCTILSSFDPERLLHDLEVSNATNIFVVPTHVSALFALPSATLNRRQFPALKTIISNAAPLPQPAKEKMVAYFGEGVLYECYGSTEAGIVCNIRPADILRKPDSVGQPFPYTEVAILNEDGQQLTAGDKGSVYSRSPYLFNGYWNKPDETAQAWCNGWVTAGDLGWQDEDGFLYIDGRAKDMIITGGVNVYPREVENELLAFEGVSEAAVVGVPDEHWGERVVAFLVSEHPELDLAALGAHCKAQLSNFKIPKEYRIIKELPRNPTGKLLRRVLRDQL